MLLVSHRAEDTSQSQTMQAYSDTRKKLQDPEPVDGVTEWQECAVGDICVRLGGAMPPIRHLDCSQYFFVFFQADSTLDSPSDSPAVPPA